MQNFDIVGALAFFTIGAVLALAIMSWIRAKKAQDHHVDAAVAQRQRAEDGAAVHDSRLEGTTPADSGRNWSHERGANPPTPATQTPPD